MDFYNRLKEIDVPYCFMTIIDVYQYSDYWRDVIVCGDRQYISSYHSGIKKIIAITEISDVLQELGVATVADMLQGEEDI